VGCSYGEVVLGKKDNKWTKQGVIKAIEHLMCKWSKILLVTKRRWLKEDPDIPALVEVVFAQRDDDPIVLQLSHRHQCAVVSQDQYQTQMEDRRLEPQVREWWKAISPLQLEWSWQGGHFIMNYNLTALIPRPADSSPANQSGVESIDAACQWCHWCGKSKAATEGRWYWSQFTCKSCWAAWRYR